MEFRYSQFCPIARACEILGSRWTLLVIRNLFTGPQRFSDLLRTLPGISSSVLSQRLEQLEQHGIVSKRELPPPAASRVYELTESGRDLKPALAALLRWGLRFMVATRPDDHVEAAWVPMALEVLARKSPTPDCSIELRIRGHEGEPVVVTVRGGPAGVRVTPDRGAAEIVVETDPRTLMALALGILDSAQAIASQAVSVEGDPLALDVIPELFHLQTNAAAASDPGH